MPRQLEHSRCASADNNGMCCPGHEWEVSAILDSVWGNCSNPDCPAYDMTIGPDDHYRGVSYKDVYDIAEWMLDHPQ